LTRTCVLAWLVCAIAAAEQSGFVTDPNSPTLQVYAAPTEIDESQYGCGPLEEPGETYYVALDGDDGADGLSWETAWRTPNYALKQLQAGDTLLIGEGEYRGPSLSVSASGEAGRPIRIMAAPGQRVISNSASRVGPFRKSPDLRYAYEAPLAELEFGDVWEADSLVKLQDAASVERVDELPGTYYFDAEKQKLYVQFSDGRSGEGRFVECRRSHRGIALTTSYVHLRGIWFKHGWEGVLVKTGHHNTVENCVFFANVYHGMCVRVGAHWNLIKNNYGFNNPMRGTILMKGSSHDNLLIGNRGDPSPPTVRTRQSNYHYAMNNYGGDAGPCNFIINNILSNSLSFRWKPPVKQTVFQGNIAVGTIYSQKARWNERTPEDRMVLRNNVLLGSILWQGGLGPDGGNGNWLDEDKAFVNNFHADGDPEAIADARFADPAYLDYRLQADSPLIGEGMGGLNRGAFPHQTSRIFYVGPDGDDANPGTSERLAFGTLERAADALQPGDTLYVMAGEYPGPLTVRASGQPDAPIQVRAYHRARFNLPGLVLGGSHLHVEGFAVARAEGDGVVVSGSDNRLESLLVSGCKGAGLRARGAASLTLNHCTLVENRSGLALTDGATNATMRNCIVAFNRDAQSQTDESSRAGYRGYNTCYFGAGVDREGGQSPKVTLPILRSADSIVADPKFVDASQHDYRLTWDSPARYLAEFARPAGSEAALSRKAEVADVRVVSIQREAAVVRWETPTFDTTGEVHYRVAQTGDWRTVEDTNQGSVHAVGLVELEPQTRYEFRIEVENRRGPGMVSEVHTFDTAAQSREPATFYVSPDGDDDADGRTPQTAWRTMRQACFSLQPGDTVLVAPGEYRHAIAPITSGLPEGRITFRKHGEGKAVINGMGVLSALVSLEHKHYITIEGFDLDTGPTDWVVAPKLVTLTGCRGVEIINCRRYTPSRDDLKVGDDELSHWASSGVHAIECSDLRIEGNVIWGARYPLRIFGCEGVLIKNNTLALKSVVMVQIGDTGLDDHEVRFINNLLYENRSFRNAFFWVNEGSSFDSDYNLYYTTDETLGVGSILGESPDPVAVGADLAQWQQVSGQDRHSLEADPMFVSPEKRDFRLRPGSPAIGAGQGGATIGALGVAR